MSVLAGLFTQEPSKRMFPLCRNALGSYGSSSNPGFTGDFLSPNLTGEQVVHAISPCQHSRRWPVHLRCLRPSVSSCTDPGEARTRIHTHTQSHSLYWQLVTVFCKREAVKFPVLMLKGNSVWVDGPHLQCFHPWASSPQPQRRDTWQFCSVREKKAEACAVVFFPTFKCKCRSESCCCCWKSFHRGQALCKRERIVGEKKKFLMCYYFQEECCVSRFFSPSMEWAQHFRKCVSRPALVSLVNHLPLSQSVAQR